MLGNDSSVFDSENVMNEMIHLAKVTGRRARKVEGGVFFVSIVASSSSSSPAFVLKVCPRACWTTTITALHAPPHPPPHTNTLRGGCLVSPYGGSTNEPAPLTDDADTLTMHRVFRSTAAELTSRHAELSSANGSRTCRRRRILIDKSANWASRAQFFTAFMGLESWKDDRKHRRFERSNYATGQSQVWTAHGREGSIGSAILNSEPRRRPLEQWVRFKAEKSRGGDIVFFKFDTKIYVLGVNFVILISINTDTVQIRI